MATEKPRFTITMNEDLLQQVDEFKFKHRYKSQTQAVIALIEKGFQIFEAGSGENLPKKQKAPEPANAGAEALSVDDVVSAFVAAGFVEPGQDLSDADFRFLLSIGEAIRAWFCQS